MCCSFGLCLLFQQIKGWHTGWEVFFGIILFQRVPVAKRDEGTVRQDQTGGDRTRQAQGGCWLSPYISRKHRNAGVDTPPASLQIWADARFPPITHLKDTAGIRALLGWGPCLHWNRPSSSGSNACQSILKMSSPLPMALFTSYLYKLKILTFLTKDLSFYRCNLLVMSNLQDSTQN